MSIYVTDMYDTFDDYDDLSGYNTLKRLSSYSMGYTEESEDQVCLCSNGYIYSSEGKYFYEDELNDSNCVKDNENTDDIKDKEDNSIKDNETNPINEKKDDEQFVKQDSVEQLNMENESKTESIRMDEEDGENVVNSETESNTINDEHGNGNSSSLNSVEEKIELPTLQYAGCINQNEKKIGEKTEDGREKEILSTEEVENEIRLELSRQKAREKFFSMIMDADRKVESYTHQNEELVPFRELCRKKSKEAFYFLYKNGYFFSGLDFPEFLVQRKMALKAKLTCLKRNRIPELWKWSSANCYFLPRWKNLIIDLSWCKKPKLALLNISLLLNYYLRPGDIYMYNPIEKGGYRYYTGENLILFVIKPNMSAQQKSRLKKAWNEKLVNGFDISKTKKVIFCLDRNKDWLEKDIEMNWCIEEFYDYDPKTDQKINFFCSFFNLWLGYTALLKFKDRCKIRNIPLWYDCDGFNTDGIIDSDVDVLSSLKSSTIKGTRRLRFKKVQSLKRKKDPPFPKNFDIRKIPRIW